MEERSTLQSMKQDIPLINGLLPVKDNSFYKWKFIGYDLENLENTRML